MRKRYVGSIYKETDAARLYDFFAIMAHGLKAKSNFSYTKLELLKMAEDFTVEVVDKPADFLREDD